MIVLIFILLPISAVLFLTEKYLNSNYNKDWKPQQAHLFGHALQYNRLPLVSGDAILKCTLIQSVIKLKSSMRCFV